MICMYACCLLPDQVLLDAVATIALVKPDKACGIENMILQMAQRGQLTEKVSRCMPSPWQSLSNDSEATDCTRVLTQITHHKESNLPGTLWMA